MIALEDLSVKGRRKTKTSACGYAIRMDGWAWDPWNRVRDKRRANEGKGKEMSKEIGNLAIVCGSRKDAQMLIYGGYVFLTHEKSPGEHRSYSVKWDDDAAISDLILKLNHGDLTKKKKT